MIAPETAGSTINGEDTLIFSLRLGRRTAGPGAAERRALEDWVRLRFQLTASDPMIAIIGAVARLTDAGMGVDDATKTVLRILNEEVTDRPDPRPMTHGLLPTKSVRPPLDAL